VRLLRKKASAHFRSRAAEESVRNGRAIRDFRATWVAACQAVGLPGLFFHDLRRSGARNYRRAQVTEDVIMRIGGWKAASMLRRYNVVDERDLTEAAERLSNFLTNAASNAADDRAVRGRSGAALRPRTAPEDIQGSRTRTIEAPQPLHRRPRRP
jgi:hypothetical protein